MKIGDIIRAIEEVAPLPYQESYDNSGLYCGSVHDEATGALFTLDVTEEVVDEAIEAGYNLIVAHHPLIFKPLKRILDNSITGRCIIKAIKNDIAVYAAHTNLDNVHRGVNAMICSKLGLVNCRILQPAPDLLKKLVVFVPEDHAEIVRQAMFTAGAGHIGNYDSCSFNAEGHGTFRALDGADPFVGAMGSLHSEPEVRIETICESHALHRIVKAMIDAHPYEEVAWDAYPLVNLHQRAGSGMMGEFSEAMDEMDFLMLVKRVFGPGCIKYSPLTGRKVQRVALCGGSGNFLIQAAMSQNADAFITGELKYHDYFLAENRILLTEAGHYETEQFTKELLVQIVKEKFTTFATRISGIQTNPVNYL
ncbi:Nif3-like dinuclear metal center hexameric protein [Lentimicrobium sp.]|uniref:Nif3-like dinuclear metal center hexameric protein n=1 Tax=Lentimicrobium sp. TaxID=2034841 RepID=UPI002BB0A23D|nr:Nif3-like dinuclear metal center hexameric protein [Lentimicrobium sp.]HRW68056.1 Nif3-like dinuclear metal center hexameric protein [Lentimicrobium sp.]